MKYRAKKLPKVHCPYCKRPALLRPAREIFGPNSRDEMLWVCSGYPQCDAMVRAHQKDLRPMGTLGNAAVRKKRLEAHRALDAVLQAGIMTRREIYQLIQFKFGFRADQAHIGHFNEYMCGQVIEMANQILTNRTNAAS
jgi:ssDNA-binding Zn-finger/Zn-ribbon topoisomerase 1